MKVFKNNPSDEHIFDTRIIKHQCDICYLTLFMNKSFILIILLIISFQVKSSERSYIFKWSFMPVSQLVINFPDKDDRYPKFSIETVGALKLYRKYKAVGFLDFKNKNEWTYSLSGSDRGNPETKIISYSKKSFPQIIEFVDDEGERPISIDLKEDIGSLDPFSVILNIIRQIELNGNCDTTMRVYDGKRRYIVSSKTIKSMIDNKIKNTILIECKLDMIGSFEDDRSKNNKWPFNGEKRSMSIFFDNSYPFLPVKFSLRTPIGIISGEST